MWPGRIDLVLGLDTCLRELKIRFLDIRQRPEDVLLDHCHDIVEVRNDEADDGLLILQVLLDLIDGIEPLSFAFDILGLIFVVIVLLANEQFLLEALLSLLATALSSISNLVASTRGLVLSCCGSALLRSCSSLLHLIGMLTHF